MNADHYSVKLYFAYTSPFSYLAIQPAYDLETTHRVRIRFIPYGVNIRKVYGPLDRADADRRKVRYLYLDARRIAKERGLVIYPPKKIFSARLAFYGGLFASAMKNSVTTRIECSSDSGSTNSTWKTATRSRRR
jgi:2-hydroxychromene-2-carboxylate isomerase